MKIGRGFRLALAEVSEQADRDLMNALARKERELSERHKAALAKNPWLNGTQEHWR